MLSFRNMLIRKKILVSTLLLTLTLSMLMYSSLRGVYAYRSLTISLSSLASEMGQVQNLKTSVLELQNLLSHGDSPSLVSNRPSVSVHGVQFEFLKCLDYTMDDFERHRERIKRQILASDPLLMTTDQELETINEMIATLEEIQADALQLRSDPSAAIERKLAELTWSLQPLAGFQITRMNEFRSQVRARYHTWIAFITIAATASLFIVGITFWFFRQSIVKPFKLLLTGSKSIAGGNFEHRIRMDSQDELSELADAMNNMTDRFVTIRDNLNDQVQQRTKEVVRSEQLASVGFLAAGVAHEINNPLASIAWSAEAMESRMHEALHDRQDQASDQPVEIEADQVDILRDYLKRIQDEAFRCKGITERLLDFSRLGESSKKQETDIHEAISDVCELVKHLGEYRNRKLQFAGTPGVYAWVSPTEFKQVILNLLTNALDASEDGGRVDIQLDVDQENFHVTVIDQGCGMTDEVMKHLFEPFFTRRRDGRGTGLGLSISYQIVQDHGGRLAPSSPGAGQGSQMQLTMPLLPNHIEFNERLQAA